MLRTFLARRADRAKQPRSEYRRWHAARTLADLGQLTADWLDGTLETHPGYGDATYPRPDDETAELTPTLVAVNRAGLGLVTISSQPGMPPKRGFDGTLWEQRAAVEALCDDATLDRLCDLAAETSPDLLVIIHRGARRRRDHTQAETVTRWDSRDYTEFGTRLDRSDLRLQFSACRARLRRRLFGMWQVTVIDTCWGRNSVLWPLLNCLAANQQPEQAAC
jgi:hypothetical protein